VSLEDAKRLFYAQASTFRRNHPDRQKQPVTDELREFVNDLKTHFQSENVWVGTFAAKEGLIVIPVKRRRIASVWPVAEKLARRHGLICYDPENHKLVPAKR
jgi:hypothetical protein